MCVCEIQREGAGSMGNGGVVGGKAALRLNSSSQGNCVKIKWKEQLLIWPLSDCVEPFSLT